MARRGCIILGSVVAGVAVLLVTAYQFRDALLAFGANRLLLPHQVSVEGVHGLQVSGSVVALQEMELVLHESGLRLVVEDIQLAYNSPFSATAVEPQILEIGSARLLRDTAQGSSDTDLTTEPMRSSESVPTTSEALRISDVLQLLRQLPPGRLQVHELALPYWRDSMTLDLQHAANTLHADINSDTLRLSASLSPGDSTTAARLQANFDSGTQRPLTLLLLLTPADEGYQLTATGQVDVPDVQALITALLPDVPVPPLDSLMLDWDISTPMADDIASAGSFQPLIGISAGSALAIPAGVQDGLGAIALDFAQRAEFTVTGLASLLAAGNDASLGITLQENSRLSGTLEQSIFGAYQVRSGFELSQFRLETGNALDATVAIETRQLEIQGPQPWLPQFDLAAEINFTPARLTFSSALLLPAAPLDPGLMVQGYYDPDTGSAEFSATLPTLEFLPGENRSLSAYLGGWPWSFDLMTGSLGAQVELAWQAAPQATTPQGRPDTAGVLSGSVAIQLVDAAGYYEDYFFSGLDLPFTAALDTAAPIALSTPLLHLEVALLDVGLALENLVVDFELDGDNERLSIPAVHAEALGGRLHGEDLSYQFGLARNQLTLQFTGLRLEDMLALVEYDGVAATGAVSGELPLTITATGIEVDGGTLQADQPGGSIKYLDAETDGGNASLDLVNRALSNYQFASLESSIDYRPDGELLLTMQLQGHNPNMNNGQRVNLNLTLSDNIPVLLESLQARRAIEDLLEERLQK